MSDQVSGNAGAARPRGAVPGSSLTAVAYSRAITRAGGEASRYEREVARAKARYLDSLTRW